MSNASHLTVVNPFEIFGLDPSFTLDLKALDRAYFELQKHYHPDKKIQTRSTEKDLVTPNPLGMEDHTVELNASVINAAYQTLKNPVKRAETLLNILDIPVPGQNGETIGTEIMLLDILDFQETIMMCEDHEQALEVMNDLNEHFSEEQHAFAEEFDRGRFESLPEIYIKLSYIDRLRKQVSEVEQQLFKRTSRTH